MRFVLVGALALISFPGVAAQEKEEPSTPGRKPTGRPWIDMDYGP